MSGASISATTISCNSGVGSVPTLKLSCTTPWVSPVLPSATRSCPMSPTSVTSCPRWILSNSDGWITLMVLPLKIRVPRVASSMQWFNIIKSVPIMVGASISATTTSCNTGVGSVPTLKLSCTTPWVSTVLPSAPSSCPMCPTSVTSCPHWILSNTAGWIMLMVEPESTSAIIGIPFASISRYKLPWQSVFKIISSSIDLLTWSAAESRVPDAAEFTRYSHSQWGACTSSFQVRPWIVVDEVAPRLRTLPFPMSECSAVETGPSVFFRTGTSPVSGFRQILHRPGRWGFDSAIDDPEVEPTFWLSSLRPRLLSRLATWLANPDRLWAGFPGVVSSTFCIRT